jgi:transposase
LVDRRSDNGTTKVGQQFLTTLRVTVAGRPADFGLNRPTWTQELLCQTLEAQLCVRVCPGTMSRALQQLGARQGAPKPIVKCPWPAWKRQKRLRELRKLFTDLPDDELLFYEDEVDIHLNPKIGRDWMLPGQQKEVVTPGQNQKRYVAGAKNARTGELIWVEGDRKDTYLFLLLLWELVQRHPTATVIHVILDNFGIHDTLEVRSSLKTEQGVRLRLHFLPPYSPDENAIERVWKDLHDNVTRNHQCANIEELLQQVDSYLAQRNQSLAA